MLVLDGSKGEGGGQILRTALALSLCTGRAFRLENVRAGREKPGLRRQHLTAVRAAQEIGGAGVAGAELGATRLEFSPSALRPGHYSFDVGTAGSTSLVLQTVLPALLTAAEPSSLVLCGGTHNPQAPPFEFLERSFLPLVRRLGPVVKAKLDRPGFYPAGGGRVRVEVRPAAALAPLELLERGALRGIRATALVANLDPEIGRRELRVVQRGLDVPPAVLRLETVRSPGPGNALVVELETERVTEVCTGFGQRGRRAEAVAAAACAQARAWLEAGAPVGAYLADQLLLPLALAGGEAFRTVEPTAHARTNAWVIEQFLPVRVEFRADGGTWVAEVRRRPA